MAQEAFHFMGPAHLTVLALTLTLSIGLPILARNVKRPGLTKAIAWTMAGVMVTNELLWYVWALWIKDFSFMFFLQNFLPLHICWAGMYIGSFALITKKQLPYEIAFYWGIGGTLQAVVTPDLQTDFPSYEFIQFYLNHGLFVVAMVYATWGMQMRPRFKSTYLVIGITVVWMAFVGVMNTILDSNYMFICDPPLAASPFFFWPWPWYIGVLVAVGVVTVFLLYSIFPITDLVKSHFKEGGAGVQKKTGKSATKPRAKDNS